MKLKKPEPTVYPLSPFKKGKQKCLVCDNVNDWKCRQTEDGGFALCSFRPSGQQDVYQRYYHVVKDVQVKDGRHKAQTVTDVIEHIVQAKEQTLNNVYTAFLESLILSEEHGSNLLRRGLADDAIARNLYATVPQHDLRYTIAQELSGQFNLEGVPGFHIESGAWCLSMTNAGFFVPYRNREGQLVGLQIRLDKAIGNKYLWFSSANKEKGASSGSPIHFVNPDLVSRERKLVITEGAMKADIIGSRWGQAVVAIARVTTMKPDELTEAVEEAFPNLQEVILAFDMDWQEKQEVKNALLRLKHSVEKRFEKVSVATWNRSLAKGLDDLIIRDDFSDGLVDYVPAAHFLGEVKTMNPLTSRGREALPLIKYLEGQEANKFLYSWAELSKADFREDEEVIFGLRRGNVGMLIASTNVGKTTLALNTAISASAGREYCPLFVGQREARRVLYIDGEATKGQLTADVGRMVGVLDLTQQERVGRNLHFICDEEIDDMELNFVNASHFSTILKEAYKCRPDLIVVDGLSALFDLEDENDNAKVKQQVIKPLKKLARDMNAGVLLLHHTGKFNEGYSPAGAYKGRGASAFGALARTVYLLEKVKGKNEQIVLECAKTKGEEFERTILELDREGRWFKKVGLMPPSSNEKGYFNQVLEFVEAVGRAVNVQEIMKAFQDEGVTIGRSTVNEHLRLAEEQGRVRKPKFGWYIATSVGDAHGEMPLAE